MTSEARGKKHLSLCFDVFERSGHIEVQINVWLSFQAWFLPSFIRRVTFEEAWRLAHTTGGAGTSVAAQLSHGGTPLLFSTGFFVADCESMHGLSFWAFSVQKDSASSWRVSGGISITGRSIRAVLEHVTARSLSGDPIRLPRDARRRSGANRLSAGGVHTESFRDEIIELFTTGLDQSASFKCTERRSQLTHLQRKRSRSEDALSVLRLNGVLTCVALKHQRRFPWNAIAAKKTNSWHIVRAIGRIWLESLYWDVWSLITDFGILKTWGQFEISLRSLLKL